QQRVAPRPLRTRRASAGGRQQVRVVRVERGVGQAQVDFALNPVSQLAHADRTRVFVFEDRLGRAVSRKAFEQGPLLVFRLQSRHFHRVARRELPFIKGFLKTRGQLREFQTTVNIFGRSADFGRQGFHGVERGV